ncbi:helix-turn-helix domain-containing protein [Nocardia arizonensis]|uniref:helix-turn-helix domain-containing protein n=1 Tax=Nocardia arizonensis TaxID=1141647 RepID=UPI0006D1E04E|nr:helix-turn-helix transcriptional regulator [Nocardia arizonensis]
MALQDAIRVGATIRALRQAHNLRRRELADRIFISPSHLANIESGRRGCTHDVARRVAAALDVELTAITTESER